METEVIIIIKVKERKETMELMEHDEDHLREVSNPMVR
jgi:hypothetical protein